MAHIFDIVGWEDFEGNRHDGTPPDDLDDVHGTFVEVTDTETNTVDYFWAYEGGDFDEWDQWYDYIESIMEMYGISD